MVFCTYCGQSFTRDEHLERHILTHTNVKPFKCITCHMSFARRDLLQRHYQVHGRDPNNQEGLPPQTLVPKSAGRTPIACSNCAKTKTKCDKKFPCSRCAARNLNCTLRPTRRQTKSAQRAQSDGDGTTTLISPPETAKAADSDASKSTSPLPFVEQSIEQASPLVSHSSRQQINPRSSSESSQTVEPAAATFESTPRIVPPMNMPSMLSPLPTPGTISCNGFVSATPISGFEFGSSGSDGSDNKASPRYFPDWGHFQFPPNQQYEQMARPDLILATGMNSGIGLSMDGIVGTHSEPGILSILPEFAQALPRVSTPVATPPKMLEGTMSELEIATAKSLYHPSRQPSISEPCTGDIPQVLAAQDGWNCFRSSPTIPPSQCPRTARLNLEKLERTLKNNDLWSSWRPAWVDQNTSGDNLTVIPLQEESRDKLLAITQTFLHKALEIHRDGNLGTPTGGATPSCNDSAFILLPPSRVLQYFLRSYSNSFERFFPMSSRAMLDANERLLDSNTNDRAASLSLLLMIAVGAANIPSLETRWLTGGLTEACRLSLFDLIEKNVTMASDQTTLQSALLFTAAAAWSGDKWQMDIAMGQRGMYFAMLRHSGMLEPCHVMTPPQHRATPDGLWTDWLNHEGQSRLIYSWTMLDQDLSLFHDTAPLFNVSEFGAPMPDTDRLWQAKSAAEWSAMFEQVHRLSGGYSSLGSGARPVSLKELFRQFLNDQLSGDELTALHLRLLLHPLQGMVCAFSQLLSCFGDALGTRQKTKEVSAASTRCRLEEVQSLLKRWFTLADRYTKVNPMCAMIQSALVIFHLISLNAVTHFSEIERLARKEGLDGTYSQLMWIHKRCIYDVEEAIFHSGQVLRLIRSMPPNVRPPWWAGAVYRVALILWTDTLTHTESMSPATGLFPVAGPSFAADALAPDHTLVVRYLSKREGAPMLTKRDGSQISLDRGDAVLSHCIDVLDEGNSTRFADGIRNKLSRLAESYYSSL